MGESRITPLFSHRTLHNRHKWGTRQGVYYFLGNIPSHINHALDLYHSIGGTFVTLSEDVFHICERQGLDVICVDDKPELFLEFEDKKLERTIRYLNEHASVLIYYEIYPLAKSITSKQIMLTHGHSFKKYYIEWRQKYMPYYDLLAGLGPGWAEETASAGVAKEKVLKVGLVRSDAVIRDAGKVKGGRRISKLLDLDSAKPIITYMPTWWGPTSVHDVGIEILRNIPEKYSFIFRPHPQTPVELICKYQHIIDSEKLNACFVPEGGYKNVQLVDIYRASSAFIGDMSSVMLDALLTNKPLLFAYGNGEYSQEESVYEPIREIRDMYPSITMDNVRKIGSIVEEALNKEVNYPLYRQVQRRVFYGLEGNSKEIITRKIKDLLLNK